VNADGIFRYRAEDRNELTFLRTPRETHLFRDVSLKIIRYIQINEHFDLYLRFFLGTTCERIIVVLTIKRCTLSATRHRNAISFSCPILIFLYRDYHANRKTILKN